MSIDADIEGLERRRYAAMMASDAAALDEMCADQLLYTHSNAEQDTKRSYLWKVREGHFNYRWIECPVEAIAVHGDAALVSGIVRAEVIVAGTRVMLNNRSLAVWSKASGIWQFVAYQPTPMVQHPDRKPPAASRVRSEL